MTKRLLCSYIALAVLILVALEVPLGLLARSRELAALGNYAQRNATALSVVAGEYLEHGRAKGLSVIAARYRSTAGGEVDVIGPGGVLLTRADPDHDHDPISAIRAEVSSALSGMTVLRYVRDEHQPVVEAVVPLELGGKGTGAVVLSVPAVRTWNRIQEVWIGLGAFAAGVLVLTVVVGWLLARSLARPLSRLQAAVAAYGAGDLHARCGASEGPEEMRALASQFDRMADRLQELIDAQSRFVADASHQLRSPLTALRLRLENLQGENAELDNPGPQGDSTAAGQVSNVSVAALAGVNQELQRLSRLVDGLLALSRADSDPAPSPQSIDVAEVVRQRCDAWDALGAERGINIRSELAVGGRTTSGETTSSPVGIVETRWVPGDLEQILDNLLANALEASPAGEEIVIRIEIDAAAGHNGADVRLPCSLHVLDHGPGMSEKDRVRAFDRFWQGPGDGHGSSGLGLAIVRQLASRNQASVGLFPAPTGGLDAVVTFTLASARKG